MDPSSQSERLLRLGVASILTPYLLQALENSDHMIESIAKATDKELFQGFNDEEIYNRFLTQHRLLSRGIGDVSNKHQRFTKIIEPLERVSRHLSTVGFLGLLVGAMMPLKPTLYYVLNGGIFIGTSSELGLHGAKSIHALLELRERQQMAYSSFYPQGLSSPVSGVEVAALATQETDSFAIFLPMRLALLGIVGGDVVRLWWATSPSAQGLKLTNNIRRAYDQLGLRPGSSKEMIKHRYWELSKRYHPDMREANPDKFKSIHEAYKGLTHYSDNELSELSWYFRLGQRGGTYRSPIHRSDDKIYLLLPEG